MRPKTIYQELNSLITARANCERTENAIWLDRHEDRITDLMQRTSPSGSGIDNGTEFDWKRSVPGKRLVFTFGFHFMDENGYYDGWGDYQAWITPSFNGINVEIKGRNRNDIKSYLRDVFDTWLNEVCPEPEPAKPETGKEV